MSPKVKSPSVLDGDLTLGSRSKLKKNIVHIK